MERQQEGPTRGDGDVPQKVSPIQALNVVFYNLVEQHEQMGKQLKFLSHVVMALTKQAQPEIEVEIVRDAPTIRALLATANEKGRRRRRRGRR